jgi:hypothetical protein
MPGQLNESCGVLTIDFRHCSPREIELAYENLAVRLCTTLRHTTVLLRTGTEDPELHYALLGALRAVARISAAPLSLQIAVVGTCPGLEHICRAIREELGEPGFDTQFFHAVSNGARWLLAHQAFEVSA